MKNEFFLSAAAAQALYNHATSDATFKGIVFAYDDVAKTASIQAVGGAIGSDNRFPVLSGSAATAVPCPYPPPCHLEEDVTVITMPDAGDCYKDL
jgi:hypothetical protein